MIMLWPIRILLLAATLYLNFSEITDVVGADHTSQTTHSFPLSESELRDLAQTLAPKVDLFRAVWEKDSDAEFFAGTTRDYLYWILGHFKGLENLDSSKNGTKQSDARREKIEAIKAKLLATPFIKFNEIVGPESDADIMTKNRDVLSALRAEDFAIRKLDFISFDRATPDHPMYQDEINQGYIPSEKIRLSKKGIAIDPNFGNGVSDLLTGNLSIQFPDITKFWKTHYAKEGSNHPLLLALRYVRILAQDYLQRHGSEIPDTKKLEAPITNQVKINIQELIRSAIADSDDTFKKFLKNEQGRKWLNASIQKSFRSFTNANAAFNLMKELGLLGLIEVYPNQIESVHQYLLKTIRDETKIAENFHRFGINPEELYQDISTYLPDFELFHGTSSDLAFRNIIYQGVIPSERGSAGRGLYGVSKKDLEFAKEWSKTKSQQDDLVIALKIKSSAKIVDITQGKGKELFFRWINTMTPRKNVSTSNLEDFDLFAKDFGIDLLRYPYTNLQNQRIDAFALKNADQILSRRGVFKNPRPLSELLFEADKAKQSDDLTFLKDFLETPLTKDERNKIISILGAGYFRRAIENDRMQNLKKLLNVKIVSLLEYLLYSPLTSIHSLIWNEVPSLLKDPNNNIRWSMAEAVTNHSAWPSSFWDQVPYFLKDLDQDVRWNMNISLRNQPEWALSFWSEVPALLHDPNQNVRLNIVIALKNQTIWTPQVWLEVPALLRDPVREVRLNLAIAVEQYTIWTPQIWEIVPTLLKDPDPYIQLKVGSALKNHSNWPDSFWNDLLKIWKSATEDLRVHLAIFLSDQSHWPLSFWNDVPNLLKDPKNGGLTNIAEILTSQREWPDSFWNQVPAILRDSNEHVRSDMMVALRQQAIWTPQVWNEVPALLKDLNYHIRSDMANSLRYQSHWPTSFWNEVPAILRDPNENVRLNIALPIQLNSDWPTSFWNEVPALLKDPNESVRLTMAGILKRNRDWPDSFWDQVPSLLKDLNHGIRSSMVKNLRNQIFWPQDIINIVAQSHDPTFQEFKKMKPSRLDITSCEKDLSTMPNEASHQSGKETTSP